MERFLPNFKLYATHPWGEFKTRVAPLPWPILSLGLAARVAIADCIPGSKSIRKPRPSVAWPDKRCRVFTEISTSVAHGLQICSESSIQEMELLRNFFEDFDVGLQPGAEEVCHAVVLSGRRDQRIALQNLDVVLDKAVLYPQRSRQLVQITGSLPESDYDSGPALAPASPAQKIPEQPAQFWVVWHEESGALEFVLRDIEKRLNA
jgi:hypothetical protein